MSIESQAAPLVTQYLDEYDDWTSTEFEETARHYARRAELEHPINRAPSTVAAAAIYLAGLLVNEKLTQEEVTTATGVSDVSIRECYYEMLECEGFENPRQRRARSETEQPKGRFRRLLNSVLE